MLSTYYFYANRTMNLSVCALTPIFKTMTTTTTFEKIILPNWVVYCSFLSRYKIIMLFFFFWKFTQCFVSFTLCVFLFEVTLFKKEFFLCSMCARMCARPFGLKNKNLKIQQINIEYKKSEFFLNGKLFYLYEASFQDWFFKTNVRA